MVIPERKNIGFILLRAFDISASMLRACLGCHIWLKFKQTLTLAFRQVLVLIIILHGGRGHNYRGGGKCILMWLFRTSLSTLTRPSTTALLNALNFKWCLIIKQNIRDGNIFVGETLESLLSQMHEMPTALLIQQSNLKV